RRGIILENPYTYYWPPLPVCWLHPLFATAYLEEILSMKCAISKTHQLVMNIYCEFHVAS
ncbi:MAG: hypothetical protein KBF82_13735, partial [Chitinophagaceae bacterium]|nr:hypothetical protein [Chitinophagaceae bacterium]